MSVPLPRATEPEEPGDAELIAAVRSGDSDAYGVLYRRHAGSALALARQLTGSRAEADDLVAESFAKVLDMLRAGGGPDAAFRAYLLTTLRNALYDRARRDRKLELSDDMTRHDPGVPWEDTAVAGLESALAARAFNRLPERWQTVLWHTEVEQESPAQVAPLLGLTPNGVAALAYRAREGLRQAYLQEHLANGVDDAHRATVNRLGAWARGGLSARHQARVDAHLAVCADCRALAAELKDVNGRLRSVIAPLVLGAGAAAYLAHVTGGAGAGTAAAAGTAAVAGGAGVGGAGGAGGAAAGGAAAGGAGASGAAAGVGGAAAAAPAGAGGAGAGGAAAGGAAGGAAAGAGGAASGGAAAAVGEAAAAGTAAATGSGSVISTVTAWVAGTHTGQAVAAATVAVVIGGTTVVATNHGGAAGPATGSASAATASSTNGLPGPQEQPPPTTPVSAPAGSATATGTATGTAVPGASGTPIVPPAGGGSPTALPTGGGPLPTGVPPTGGPTGAPVPPPVGGRPVFVVGVATAVGILHQGSEGQLALPIGNTGGDAETVAAAVHLPAGFSAVPGSGGDGWTCAGSGRTATCTRDRLEGGRETTLQVPVEIGDGTLGGMVTGTVGSGPTVAALKPSPLAVLP